MSGGYDLLALVWAYPPIERRRPAGFVRRVPPFMVKRWASLGLLAMHRFSRNTFLALLLFLSFLTSALSEEKSYKENSEAWPVTSSWIKEIPPDQQVIAAAKALGALNRKTASLLEHRQDSEQVMWVAKITACGYSMLSKVLTKSPSFQAYLMRHSDLYVRFIRGEVRAAEFSKADEALIAEGQDVLSKAFDDEALKATTTQYKERIVATERSLVVYSMLCAK